MARTNPGTAVTYPIVKFIGPGRIYQLKNLTTGDEIYFDLDLLSGETAVLDLTPGRKTFVSTFRGNLLPLGAVLPGSDVVSFKLIPGSNNISIIIDDATAQALISHPIRFLSYDG
jgi:hypothetical protein